MALDQVVAEMKRRQASYIRREDKQKQQIETLERELANTRADHNDGFLDTEKECDLMAPVDSDAHSALWPVLRTGVDILQVSRASNEKGHSRAA